ncbi:MAG: ChaN family lipoprotein [Thioalkalivibrio sp.]|nr:ChaN family lipoprotein [Thioalkalivibrio sp.]
MLSIAPLVAPVRADAIPQPDTAITAWSAASATEIDRETLKKAILAADYLVIGEIHDNPHHHRLQAELTAQFADGHGNAASVGFEQLSVEQQPLIDTFYRRGDLVAADFGEAVNWSDSGWPDYAIYRPLFAAALQRNLPIVPLMFSSDVTRAIVRDGIGAALPEAAITRLRPDRLLSAQEKTQLESEMQDAHCGGLPDSMLPAMVDVQIARDAFMAYRIEQAADRAVIITGNGHARRDRGIPAFLQRARPDAHIVVVTLLEGSESQTAEEQIRQQATADVTDFALLTPAHPREDPCLAFQ